MSAETITQELEQSATKPPRKRSSTGAKKKGAAPSAGAKKGAAGSKPTRSPQAASLSPQMAALPREIGGLLLLAFALGILLAIVSFDPQDIKPAATQVHNLIGPAGAFVADILLAIFGIGAFCVDALMWYVGALLLLGRRPEVRPAEYTGQALFVLSGAILAHLIAAGAEVLGHAAGGFIGEFIAELLRGLFGTVGAYMVALVMAILSLMFVAKLSLSVVARYIAAKLHKLYAYLRHHLSVYLTYRQRFAEERARHFAETDPSPHALAQHQAELAARPIGSAHYAFEDGFEQQVESKLAMRLARFFGQQRQPEPYAAPQPQPQATPPRAPQAPQQQQQPQPQPLPPAQEEAPKVEHAGSGHKLDEIARELKRKKRKGQDEGPQDQEITATPEEGWTLGEPLKLAQDGPQGQVGDAHHHEDDEVEDASGDTMQVDDEDVLNNINLSAEQEPQGPLGDEQGDFGPRIVDGRSAQERRIRELLTREDGEGVLFKPQARGSFELPTVSFLNYEDSDSESVDIETLRKMAGQIEQTLRDFKVEGAIKDICPGPVITVFEFSPAPGVKISKIANLSDDLAMALSALSVRIVAPIPGKGVVGIEVPNPKREMVFMKEIIADDTFIKNTKMSLPMGLGKDTAGNPIVTDLAKMPHLLVAGSTGSGKSVAVNTMITSLLYRNSPDDVRMIMVDPKMLEFSIYADIPHLLLPVVTDPKQATVALNWAVQEMERRYHSLAELNVRNIKGYNQKVEELTKQAQLDMEQGMETSSAIKSLGIDAEGKPSHLRLPYIVVIIDEFADLMMTASKDVETAVARLAQKARAAGIHLILATQRPSTDVITGLIKANFPTRIALRVTSKTDSRVILDHNGAENLLGNGDMLFVPPGTSHMQRVHGAYVSEKEIEKIVEFLKQQGKPQYDESILQEEPGEEEDNGIDESEKDEYYRDAVRLVIESKQASISMIQRKLRVGYNRAARMVEMMEIEGIVSPADSCKPRQVIVDISPY